MELISYEKALQKESTIYIDVRSPGEFAESTIPNAINIPVFNNKEREKIGKVYTNESPEKARMLGVDLLAPKLPELVRKIKKIAKKYNYVILFCARGGLRSESIGVISEIVGMKLYKLDGGYKSYRHFILDRLEEYDLQSRLLVIHGYTGVGKTDLLYELDEVRMPIIDLEGLANHRGSAFGSIGLDEPTNQKMFDSVLWERLEELNGEKIIAVEAESKRIGISVLPDFFLDAMDDGVHILIESSLKARVNRIFDEYVNSYNQEPELFIDRLLESLSAIQKYIVKRVGKQGYRELVKIAKEGKLKEVVKILLTEYYDPMYKYSQDKWGSFALEIESDNLQKIAKDIIKFMKNY
ncbi:tRNA 2-selenouridine(34) synthase MnmH [Selenihalanaerobacter shriftii]|uniref:tRNA 2-selenouridine synthase n=1 Tax=Selenihalanaerobacter shriftii TaxID=142842 RepID=A0A1T4PAD9_9FIRM|nr:tRNA 2-selenouridine(34) synthase MnmH [Selenihalanaerobacter shriftii]SJZ88429.1 tRNA 2-selenouridine synthase [Selenihalanaerobacter shriftii]